MVNFGDNIRYYRLRAGLTQAETCIKIGWKLKDPSNGGAISAYEKNVSGYTPGMKLLERFAIAFGCSVADLVAEELPADAHSILSRSLQKERGSKAKLAREAVT
jgi:transcriptional regulator with XRE-family HTH domain